MIFVPQMFDVLTNQNARNKRIDLECHVINIYVCKVYSADIYILLKRSLESFARISLYKTSADSEGVDRPSYNFSENIPCMTISYFCEEQLVLNHTTLTVQKPPF